MQHIIRIGSHEREELIDITAEVAAFVEKSGVKRGLVSVYAQGSTAAVMIQENWDESVQRDVVNLLRKLIPKGVWLHDAQDGNGDAHLKSGLVGPSETIPVVDGMLGLSRWQNIFFCEFDGPRSDRRVLCTLIADEDRPKRAPQISVNASSFQFLLSAILSHLPRCLSQHRNRSSRWQPVVMGG
jgi:secondary thiamine-phosphate synthase enzyme